MDVKVVTAPTEGDWQIRSDYLREDEHTIIANVDGEYIDGCQHCTYDTIARCRDEYDEYLPNAASNARLIVSACNSYQRHCTDPVSAAEGDLLGRCVEALRKVSAVRSTNWNDGDDPEMVEAYNAVDAILSQVREVTR